MGEWKDEWIKIWENERMNGLKCERNKIWKNESTKVKWKGKRDEQIICAISLVNCERVVTKESGRTFEHTRPKMINLVFKLKHVLIGLMARGFVEKKGDMQIWWKMSE